MGVNGPAQSNGAQAGWRAASRLVPAAWRSLLASGGNNAFEADYLKVVQRSLHTTSPLPTVLAANPVAALPTAAIARPNGSTPAQRSDALAKQPRVVAQLVAAGPNLGMKRQVFRVQIGGFDSHSNQVRDQPLLMARVAQSVHWVLGAMQAQGLLNKLLLFSASDFDRTLASNGDGCDHDWASHHQVAGGAMRGRVIYSGMPVTALGTADDLGSGQLLPRASVTQAAATWGGWMALNQSELRSVPPNLAELSTGSLGLV